MKVVINTCYGGFGLSAEAVKYLNKTYGLSYNRSLIGSNTFYLNEELKRNDPRLIDCVETLGVKANGRYADLKIVEIPDDVKWEINDYDGAEIIEEVHRSWF